MKKFVIYTVQTGGYDNVQQPLVVDERFDYILFTDSADAKQKGVWQVRSIPYQNADLTRLSRYPKMHPNELLSDYAASLYIDANIQINIRIAIVFMMKHMLSMVWIRRKTFSVGVTVCERRIIHAIEECLRTTSYSEHTMNE